MLLVVTTFFCCRCERVCRFSVGGCSSRGTTLVREDLRRPSSTNEEGPWTATGFHGGDGARAAAAAAAADDGDRADTPATSSSFRRFEGGRPGPRRRGVSSTFSVCGAFSSLSSSVHAQPESASGYSVHICCCDSLTMPNCGEGEGSITAALPAEGVVKDCRPLQVGSGVMVVLLVVLLLTLWCDDDSRGLTG